MENWSDSITFYQEFNSISNNTNTITESCQTEPPKLQNQESFTDAQVSHDCQTIEPLRKYQINKDDSIESFSTVLSTMLTYIKKTENERKVLTETINSQMQRNTSQLIQNTIDIKRLANINYEAQNMFFLYREGRLHCYVRATPTQYYQYFAAYPFYLQQRQCMIQNESNKLLSSKLQCISHAIPHPLNKNMFIMFSESSQIHIVNIQNGETKCLQPHMTSRQPLVISQIVGADFSKATQMKQFQIILAEDSGRVLILGFQEDKFTPIGGLKLRMKSSPKPQESGRTLTAFKLVETASDKRVRIFVGFEDGAVQLIEFMGERAAQINSQEDLQEFTGQKVVTQFNVRPPVAKLDLLNVAMFANQQQHIQAGLKQFCFVLDGGGSLVLYKGEPKVRYFSQHNVVDFCILQRCVVALTTSQLLIYELWSGQPVQFPIQELTLKNEGFSLQIVSDDPQQITVLVIDKLKQYFQLLAIPLSSSLLLVEELGKQMYWACLNE